ncbi:hypothetical protein [Parasphingopyxis sp.]|uniref:hypothetical protein n=1 Tax=Parasphingopyxis sp. TaxID=1920299 RepID=UPI0026377A9C|nr:hypothetical protein [Parasphingopyxis sp.]
MARYGTVSRRITSEEIEWYDDEEPLMPDIQVDLSEAVETGLVDPSGSTIYRLPNGIGFCAEVD